MRLASAPRGQPLLVLGLLLAGWVGLRVALWQSPLLPPAGLPLLAGVADAPVPDAPSAARRAQRWPVPAPDPRVPAPLPRAPNRPLAPHPFPVQGMAVPMAPPPPPRLLAGHNALLLAGLSALPLAETLAAHVTSPRGALPQHALAAGGSPFPRPMPAARRWSGDGWLLLREEGTAALAPGQGAYGRSQAGAVFRYRLDPQDRRGKAAYLRTSAALAGAREVTLAAGISARPLPELPLVAAAELRAIDRGAGVTLAPAGFAYSELPLFDLPHGLRGEAYLQAGYVGGDFASGFADGQARIDRAVTRVGEAELRAGGGIWGGAQRGAARLDIGPSASLSTSLAETPVRLSTDWRFRVAGDAVPASGPALTISAGF